MTAKADTFPHARMIGDTVTPGTFSANTNPKLNMDSAGRLYVTMGGAGGGPSAIPQYQDDARAVAAIMPRPVVNQVYEPQLVAVFYGATSSGVIKSSPGQLYAIEAIVSEAENAFNYLQFFNRTTAPAAGNTPVYSFRMYTPAAATTGLPDRLILDKSFFCHGGKYFSTGISWGLSSTAATYTAVLGATVELHVHGY